MLSCYFCLTIQVYPVETLNLTFNMLTYFHSPRFNKQVTNSNFLHSECTIENHFAIINGHNRHNFQ